MVQKWFKKGGQKQSKKLRKNLLKKTVQKKLTEIWLKDGPKKKRFKKR